MTIRIAMWSGPRNISTAMMRSFGARRDCAVSDEPFYGAFLQATGEPHPLAAETIADMDCDWHSILETQSGPAPGGKPSGIRSTCRTTWSARCRSPTCPTTGTPS